MSYELNKSEVEEEKSIDLDNNLMQNLTSPSEYYELFMLLIIFSGTKSRPILTIQQK